MAVKCGQPPVAIATSVPYLRPQLKHSVRCVNIAQLQSACAALGRGSIRGLRKLEQPRMQATAATSISSEPNTGTKQLLPTMTNFLQSDPLVSADMVALFASLQTATKLLAAKIARAGIDNLLGATESGSTGGSGDKQKKLDVVANDVMIEALTASGKAFALASEENDAPMVVGSANSPFIVVFDPLDGSRNIDAAIPTGTIFGVYGRKQSTDSSASLDQVTAEVLQPGTAQLAAGYSLYSSATMMVISVGRGTHGFTLDPLSGQFLLTHPNIQIPARGQIYSLNDARYWDWPQGLRNYIDTIRQGKGQLPKQYSARYICSLVADFHRTLLYGGWAANPRSHLRLVYEANPLSFLAEQAGGRGSDGVSRILSTLPTKLHQRLPLFLGSKDDIAELESYKDVQQVGGKYDV